MALNKQELRRQLFHAFVGLVIVFLFYYNIIGSWTIFILLVLGIITSLTLKKIRIPVIVDFLELFQREDEKNKLPGKGAIFFFTGVLLAMKLFDEDIALAAILILSLGDSVSHIVGHNYGKIKNFINGENKKLMEGTFAGIIVAFLGALFFVSPLEAILASSIAMLAELAELKLAEKVIDDNLLIPLVAGTVIVVMRLFL
ncbi:MAG: diacylglycerol/polyprenol kinase family protein [archaeon]|nr:SEC59/DGK1/VTE5 family protein [Nanoarchaeota archaeon]